MRKDILVVDDDENARLILKRYFPAEHFVVRLAENGQEALKELQSSVPDLLFLDIAMPGQSGIEVLQVVRAQNRTRRIPVIMITAHTTREYVKEATNVGVDAFIAKPFSRELVMARVAQVLHLDADQLGVGGSVASSGRLVLVDDDVALRAQVKEALGDGQWQVALAASMESAIKACRSKRPSALLMNLRMKAESPLHALKVLRADPNLFDLPTVGLCDDLENYDDAEVRDYEIDGIVGVPIEGDALVEAVREAIKKRAED